MKQIEWIKKIRDTSPRVHCITNYVTAGDVANMVLAIGGTWIARTEDIRDGHFKEITRKAKAAVEAAQRVRERSA